MRPGVLLLVATIATCAAAEQELPIYPGAVHTRIGNELVIAGEYHRLAYFTTKDDVDQVARYFRDLWTKKGIPTVVEGSVETQLAVSAFFTREGLQRAVVLRRHRGKTLGLTALKDLWVRAEIKPAPALLSLEGTLYSSDLAMREDPGSSQQRSAVIGRGFQAVKSEIAEQLALRGFRQVNESGDKVDGRVRVILQHTRQGEQVMTVVNEVDDSMSIVSQTWLASSRPDGFPTGGRKDGKR